jgi:hypothetical protein
VGRSLLSPLVGANQSEGGLAIEPIDVDVEFPTRTVYVRIEFMPEQGGAIDTLREGARVVEPDLDGFDLLDRPRLVMTLTGFARAVKAPGDKVTVWCYDSRYLDLHALLDPLGAGPPYTIEVKAPPDPKP